ncbi:MAG TPA: ATP-dependent zinc metalloprotease FtsH [Clostridiales bacterium]|nr:ATP-dependent zinc metalloprotease FtsH [Clostridiales bacterium]
MVYLLIVLAVITAVQFMSKESQNVTEMTSSEFMSKADSGLFEEVVIVAADNAWDVKATDKDGNEYKATIPPENEIITTLESAGSSVSFTEEAGDPWWQSMLIMLIPMIIILGVFIFMMNQSQGGGSKVMQFGKSKARMQAPGDKKVTFKDVAGVDEVEEELAEIVDFLKDGRKYNALGAKIPKGVLLFGYPGTGKTLLAKAVAGEAGVPFFSISGSDFVEMFVGVGASRVRDLFEQAKKNSPCIVFIDEIDAVGRQRGAGVGGGHDEREQTLNQLLVEMDGFAENSGIIVIAATNRPDILDPALLRPGRFDRQISVGMPDVKGREEILGVHSKGKPLGSDINLAVIARRTPGFSGADLANLFNEAALLAARRRKTEINMPEMEDASERVIAGPEKKSKVVSPAEKKLVSYHEAGHAVAAFYCPTADPVHKISIIPRGRAGGYTLMLPEEDRNFVTKSHMEEEIVVFLGGRIAEELILKDVSTGAQNDLQRATEIVRKMITKYGMSKEIGALTFGHNEEQVFLGRELGHDRGFSEEVASAIDKEARKMMDTAYQRCTEILTEHVDRLHAIAKLLYEKETVGADEFLDVMNGRTLPEPEGNGIPAELDIDIANGKKSFEAFDAQKEPAEQTEKENAVLENPEETVETGGAEDSDHGDKSDEQKEPKE